MAFCSAVPAAAIPQPEPWSAMIRTMIPLKGEKYRSDWINEKVFGGFNQAFPGEPSPFAWLSRDAAEVAKYEADPMCGFVFTLSGYADLMKLISRVSGENGPDGYRWNCRCICFRAVVIR